MSIELVVEVLKHAPAELNPTERLTLVAIAESCRSDTRLTFYRDGWDATELARRVGVTAESLTKVFRSLARKGYEVRVAHAVNDGKPVFAFKGKQTTFRLPRFAPQRVDESPGFSEGGEAKGWTSVRERLDDSPGNEPQSLDESPPLLLKELPSKNPSSLSPREDDASALAELDPERENDDASQEQPGPRTPIHRLLLEAGCPDNQLDEVHGELIARHEPRSSAWWRTVAKNEDLPDLVAEVLEDLKPITPKPSRTAFIASLAGVPECAEGVPGGNIPWEVDGWMHCGQCRRNAGWVAMDVQTRTEKTTNNRRYEPWRPPTDQSAYDRPFSGQIRSPADQRVADGQKLYDHYKNLEESA